MGANTFQTFATGPTARDAFRAARERAQYDHGHSGYTGTIAEKSEFVVVGTVASREDAAALARKMLDDEDPRVDDKWGPAGAIEVTGAKAPDGARTFLFFGWASS